MKECFRKSEKRLVPQKNQHLRESATLLTLRQTLYFRLLKHALRKTDCIFQPASFFTLTHSVEEAYSEKSSGLMRNPGYRAKQSLGKGESNTSRGNLSKESCW